jgi:quercetin dioxygenase-like cupin family protein
MFALCISVVLSACNNGDKKDEQAKTTDSTATTKTEVVPPATQDATPDAIKAAPNLYKVISDTMGIRIVEADYKPGDSSALHSHPDYAIYAAEGGTATFYGKDGTKMVNEMKTGVIMVRAGEVHSVKNTGKTNIKVILVEVNRPRGTVSQDASMDAAKVAPNLYKVKSDTLGIRVLEVTYKPGQSSAMHAHPDNALYVTQGGKSEFTAKDGTKTVHDLKTGMAMVLPGGVHSVKNIGTTTTKALLIEVSRPMN